MRASLISDERGIAVVEFAFIAPVLILLIAGVMEFAYVQSARSTLESATIKAGRLVAASDCPALRAAILADTIRTGMEDVTSADGQPPSITARAYGSQFGQVGQPEPYQDTSPRNDRYDEGESFTDVNGNGEWDTDMGTSGSLGGAGQVVSYSASFKVVSLLPFIAQEFAGADHWVIRASTVVRNEPVFRTTGCTP